MYPGAEQESPLLSALFGNSPDGIAFLDAGLVIRNANQNFAQRVRLPLDRIVGATARDAISGWTEQLDRAAIRARDTGQPFQTAAHAMAFEGAPERDTIYCDIWMSPVRARNDTLIGIILIVRDVTQREGTLREPRKSEERYRTLLELSHDLIWLLDGQGNVVWHNEHAEKLTGNKLTDLAGKGFGDFLLAGDIPRVIRDFGALLAGTVQGFDDYEIEVLRADGTLASLSANAVPIRMGGEVTGVVFFARDVTERKRAEEQSRKLAEQLREVNEQLVSATLLAQEHERASQEYLSILSHDLRNPLTVVLGYAQALRRTLEKLGAKEQDRQRADHIVRSARGMNAMIEDLVDSVRVHTGNLRLELKPVDLRQWLQELLERQTIVVGQDMVSLRLVEASLIVEADPDRLERILVNLLTNAIRYSSSDTRVVVGAELIGQEALVSVADQGVGISDEDLPHIFERFHKFKGAGRTGGVGLGLHITRMLLEAQGGRIWVESKLGKGTTFYFTLPLA